VAEEPPPERNTVTINLAAAELVWIYHTAARLARCVVTGSPGAFTITGTLLNGDDGLLSQRPLTVVTPNGWRWRVLELQIAGATFTASIAPQER